MSLVLEDDLIASEPVSNRADASENASVNADNELALVVYHLSPTRAAFAARPYTQAYIYGYNIMGRPQGLWLAYGMEWLKKTRDFNNPRYPSCCYLYEVRARGRFYTISAPADLRALYKQYPSYWLNLDYYAIPDVQDALTGARLRWRAANMPKRALAHYRACAVPATATASANAQQCTLAQYKKLGLVFTSATRALAKSRFYRAAAAGDPAVVLSADGSANASASADASASANARIDIERFRILDWAAVMRDYDGVIFDYYDVTSRDTSYYFWYQSLDLRSVCLWNYTALEQVALKYRKVSPTEWALADAHVRTDAHTDVDEPPTARADAPTARTDSDQRSQVNAPDRAYAETWQISY